MSKMTSEQMRRWALSMYLNENRTQAEIAEACGVSRQTVIRWAKADKWDEHKASLTMTREEQIKNLQRQIMEINNVILGREQGQRFATPKEASSRRSWVFTKLSAPHSGSWHGCDQSTPR